MPRDTVINGVKVISYSLPIHVASTAIGHTKGAVFRTPPHHGGIGALVAAMIVENALPRQPALSAQKFLARNNIELGYEAHYEYILFYMRYVSSYQDLMGQISRDLFISPSFDSSAFERAKERLLRYWATLKNNPREWLLYQVRQDLFRNTPYAIHPYGTPETIRQISYQDAKKYYESLLQERQGVIIARIGEGDEHRFFSWIDKNLRFLPYHREKKQMPFFPGSITASKSTLRIFPQKGIEVAYIGMSLGAFRFDFPDLYPLMLAVKILEDRFVFNKAPVPQGGTYFSGVEPAGRYYPLTMAFSVSVPSIFIDTLTAYLANTFIKKGVTLSELVSIKNLYITEKGTEEWATLELAKSFLFYQVVTGHWGGEEQFRRRLMAVTVEDVNRAIRKYFKHIHWYYLGDPALLTDTTVFYRSLE